MLFVKDVKNWNFEFESTKGMVGKDLRGRGKRGVGYASAQVGVRSGALRSSLEYIVAKDAIGPYVMVGSSNKIAYLHHEGSIPHAILPRRAKTLRFVQNGAIRYAKRVYHPGTRPNRYLTDNLRKMVS